jgi:hypothetical protein
MMRYSGVKINRPFDPLFNRYQALAKRAYSQTPCQAALKTTLSGRAFLQFCSEYIHPLVEAGDPRFSDRGKVEVVS